MLVMLETLTRCTVRSNLSIILTKNQDTSNSTHIFFFAHIEQTSHAPCYQSGVLVYHFDELHYFWKTIQVTAEHLQIFVRSTPHVVLLDFGIWMGSDPQNTQ